MFLIKNRRSADSQYSLTKRLEKAVQNPTMSFRTITFSTTGSICSEFLQTVTSETMLEKKGTVQFS